jgi:hypothetical protein
LELDVWLGVGGFAVIWANLYLWHIRGVLERLQQDPGVPKGTPMRAAVAESALSLTAVAESALSLTAP